MKKIKWLILFALIVCVPSAQAISPGVLGVLVGVVGGVQCNASTDYIGNKTRQSSSGTSTANRVYLFPYTPTCPSGCVSGNLANAYLAHAGTGSGHVAKMLVWSQSGNTLTLVGYTSALTSTGVESEWESSALSGSISSTGTYWVGFVSDGTWVYVSDATGATMYYKDVANSYANPGTTLATIDTTTLTSTTRKISLYATVGP